MIWFCNRMRDGMNAFHISHRFQLIRILQNSNHIAIATRNIKKSSKIMQNYVSTSSQGAKSLHTKFQKVFAQVTYISSAIEPEMQLF